MSTSIQARLQRLLPHGLLSSIRLSHAVPAACSGGCSGILNPSRSRNLGRGSGLAYNRHCTVRIQLRAAGRQQLLHCPPDPAADGDCRHATDQVARLSTVARAMTGSLIPACTNPGGERTDGFEHLSTTVVGYCLNFDLSSTGLHCWGGYSTPDAVATSTCTRCLALRCHRRRVENDPRITVPQGAVFEIPCRP